MVGDLVLLDDEGQVLVRVRGIRGQKYSAAATPSWHTYEKWLYTRDWQRQDSTALSLAPGAVGRSSAWVLLMDRGGTGAALASLLQSRGETCVQITIGQRNARIEPGLFEVSLTDRDALRAVLKEALAELPACRGVIHMGSLDATAGEATTAETLIQDLELSCLSALPLFQSILRRKWRDAPRLWLLTRGMQPVGAESASVSVSQAPLWGLGHTLAMENPELRCTRIDLGSSFAPQEAAELLLGELFGKDDEDQVALRKEGRYVARLMRSFWRGPSQKEMPRDAAGQAMPIHADRTYLITGGLGGLGCQLGPWLVEKGARYLVLCGRGEAGQDAAAAVADMRAAGATVFVRQVDVSQPAAVAGLLADIDEHLPPLAGIIHAAMVQGDETLLELDEQRLAEVMAPKVLGAWNLHSLTKERPLDFFVMYSMAAALLGPPGQGGYAAANMFLDLLAHYRRSQGLCALSINWGPFAQAGLGPDPQPPSNKLSDRGLTALEPAQGFEIMGRLIANKTVQAGVLRLTLHQWCEYYLSAAADPLLSELRKERSRAKQDSAGDAQFLLQLKAAPAHERSLLLEQYLQEQIARVTHQDSSRIDRSTTFTDLGIDSLMSLELRNRLESDLALGLAVTTFFAHPSIASLAEHLAEKMAPSEPKKAPAKKPEEAAPSSTMNLDSVDTTDADQILAFLNGSLDRLESRLKSY